jgi:hypothetical protein
VSVAPKYSSTTPGGLPGGNVVWTPTSLDIDSPGAVELAGGGGQIVLYANGESYINTPKLAFFTGLGGHAVVQQSIPNDGSATPEQIAAALVASTLMAAS